MIALLTRALDLANKLLPILVTVMTAEPPAGDEWARVTPPVECGRCHEQPFTVRWGGLRVAQDLSGYYAIATVGPDPLIVCLECYEAAIEGTYGQDKGSAHGPDDGPVATSA